MNGRKKGLLAAALLLVLSLVGCGGNTLPIETQTEAAEITEKAEESTEESTEALPAEPTKDELVEALIQTAMSYYYKNPYCQYENTALNNEGTIRQTWEKSAEYASADQYHYSVCSSFITGVYYNAFGYLLGKRSATGAGIPYVTNLYGELGGPGTVFISKDNDEASLQKAAQEIRGLLEPGDIVVSYGQGGGHAMLFLGDVLGNGTNYLIHCWGSTIKSGVDKIEGAGAIYLQPEDELIFGKTAAGKPNWTVSEMRRANRFVCVYRPFLAEDFVPEIKPVAQSRMKYPNIVITRALDRSTYDSVRKGEQFTLTLTVENKSLQDYRGLKVTEVLPEGARLVSGKTEALLDVKAGGKESLSLTYEVTAEPGSTVSFAAAAVDEIPTQELSIRVGYEALSGSQQKALVKLAEQITDGQISAGSDLKAMNEIYRLITGKSVGLPDTTEEYLRECLSLKMVGEERLLKLKPETDSNRALLQMQVPKLYGGLCRKIEPSLYERTLEIVDKRFQPGDVMVAMRGTDAVTVNREADLSVYIYLGERKFLCLNDTAARIENFSTATNDLLGANQFFVLRPSLTVKGLPEENGTYDPNGSAKAQVLTTLQELKAFSASSDQTASVQGKLALDGAVSLKKKSLSLAAGSALELGDFDLELGTLTLEEGAALTAGKGKVKLTASGSAELEAMLESFAGLPVEIRCAYDTVENVYSCRDRIAYYDSVAATVGTANMTDIFLRTPSGWTICMKSGLCSGVELEIAHENITLDLNGNRIGFLMYKGKSFSVVDGAGGGTFYIRGDKPGTPRTLSVDIYAPDVPVVVGFRSDFEKADLLCRLTLDAKLTCASLRLDFGSTLELGPKGEVVEK